MASVSSPNPAATYHEGRGNKILSLTPVQSVMVRYTDPDGKESVVFCYVFGEAAYDKNTRMAGVWVTANLDQLQKQLRLAPKGIATSIIASMEEMGLLREGKVVTAGTPVVELPDVSDAFSDLGDQPEPGEEG